MTNYSSIIQPIVTEKSSIVQSQGKYVFLVKNNATKVEIKNAIKAIYGVEVEKVATSILPKKTRLIRRGRELTKRPVLKKAIITLKGKKTIDPNKIEAKKK
jgi:large subunit ribosomal protein L23